jgi:hypothetical protein
LGKDKDKDKDKMIKRDFSTKSTNPTGIRANHAVLHNFPTIERKARNAGSAVVLHDESRGGTIGKKRIAL